MNLPESFLIQCNCGSIIKIDAKVVSEKGEIDEAVSSEQGKADQQEMIREQLCQCGHMKFIHNRNGKVRNCLKSGCTCMEFKNSYWLAPAKS